MKAQSKAQELYDTHRRFLPSSLSPELTKALSVQLAKITAYNIFKETKKEYWNDVLTKLDKLHG